jgi:hypothetical protein
LEKALEGGQHTFVEAGEWEGPRGAGELAFDSNF